MKHYPQMSYSVTTDHKTPQYIDFDIVACEGPCKVIADADQFYGGKKSKAYEGELLVNPTWGQLFIEAMKQQRFDNWVAHIVEMSNRPPEDMPPPVDPNVIDVEPK
jgi:hypothetical protein